MQEPLPTSGRLPANLKVKHGPVSLLGRFFLWADSAARDHGVTLFFASLQDLLDVNKSNTDSWRPLIPIFDPILGGITPETGFALLGLDKDGQVVATQAARVYDWSGTSLAEEAKSLRMFYADPEAAFARGDYCEIATPMAKEISGRVVFSGAGWYRRDFRGKGLASILPRISRAYAFTQWSTDFTISLMADAVIAGGMADRSGYTRVEHSCVNLLAYPLGAVRCGFVWMPRDQLIDDLDALMAKVAAPIAELRVAGDVKP
jgi:predicted nucleic acid-binding Zn ribbon protein